MFISFAASGAAGGCTSMSRDLAFEDAEPGQAMAIVVADLGVRFDETQSTFRTCATSPGFTQLP